MNQTTQKSWQHELQHIQTACEDKDWNQVITHCQHLIQVANTQQQTNQK